MSAFNLNKIVLTGEIADLSTAGQIYIPIPDEFDGEVVEIRTVINNAISVADATVTAKIGGTAMTGGVITVGYDGSAAGDVDTCRPYAANTVRAGQAIEIETDGGSTTACKVGVSVVIRR